jgi:HSP20 family protein
MKSLQRRTSSPAFRPEFERLVDRFFDMPLWGDRGTRREAMWEPALDLSETNKEYVVRLEAPGVTRDDLDVSLDGNMLTLSGKRELRRHEKGEDFLWEEREEGRFARTIRLPGPVDEGKVEATYNEGVLLVKLPKSEQATRSRIAIR